MSFDPLSLFVGVATSAIGFGAWQYGRRRTSARHMILGVVLMGYSWVVDDPKVAAAIGAVLTGLLFWP